jgi:hypothetical protein
MAVAGGDPRSTVGGGSEAAGSGGAADGTETISARTAVVPTNKKTKTRALIGNVAEARFGGRCDGPDDSLRTGRERRVLEARMRDI